MAAGGDGGGDCIDYIDLHRAGLWANRIARYETDAGCTAKSRGKSASLPAVAGRTVRSAESRQRHGARVGAGAIALACVQTNGGIPVCKAFANIPRRCRMPPYTHDVSALRMNIAIA